MNCSLGRRSARTCLMAAACLLPLAASAGETSNSNAPEDVFVWGMRQQGIGRATTASEGTVLFGTFEDRPILRPGEIAEIVPGLVVTQHSGSGKANQYFMRGFNLDHGTDFSASIDGVPLNLRTHAHGQG